MASAKHARAAPRAFVLSGLPAAQGRPPPCCRDERASSFLFFFLHLQTHTKKNAHCRRGNKKNSPFLLSHFFSFLLSQQTRLFALTLALFSNIRYKLTPRRAFSCCVRTRALERNGLERLFASGSSSAVPPVFFFFCSLSLPETSLRNNPR